MFMDRMKLNPFLGMCLAIMSLMIVPLVGCGGGGGGDGWGAVQVQPLPPVTPPPADISVSRTQIAFGDVVMNSFAEETISIQNIGSSNLIIGQIAQANPLPASFSILSDNCSGKQVAPSQTCTLKVRFSPASQGPITDAFDIPSNDPVESSVTVNVSGYGLSLNVSISEFLTDSCPQGKGKLLVTVADKDANLVNGLTKDSFSLFENGVLKDETVLPSALPISVALTLDYSPSMQVSQIEAMQTGAKAFIDRLNGSTDEGAIIKFAGGYSLIQPFTTVKADLIAAVDAPYTAQGDTALYDATYFAIAQTAGRPNRRAVLLVTDGWDSAPSQRTLDEVIANANANAVHLFSIGLGTVNEAVLQRMANETGGRYIFAPTSADLTAIYLQMVADIFAGQYTLEYTSSAVGLITFDLQVNDAGRMGRTTRSLSGCP